VFHDKSTALFRELISKYGAIIVGPNNHIHFRSPWILKVSYCFIALIASLQFFTMNGSVLFIDLTRFSSLYKLKLIGKILIAPYQSQINAWNGLCRSAIIDIADLQKPFFSFRSFFIEKLDFYFLIGRKHSHFLGQRSEERRVGKECRSWWAADH